MEMGPDEALFGDFPPISAKSWKKRIIDELKGADYEKELIWKSEEGIRVDPFYTQEDLEGLGYLEWAGTLKSARSTPNGWTICQQIPENIYPGIGNQSIRDALKGGAQAIRIPWNMNTEGPGKFLESLFKGVHLEEVEVHFEGNLAADTLYRFLLESHLKTGTDPAGLKGCLGADPLGIMVATGCPVVITENLGNLVRTGITRTPGFRVVGVDGTRLREAGSTLVQELAFSLSMASDYLSVLTDQGLDPADVVRSMQLNLAIGPDFFMEIAKLRAARILWASLCEGYGLPDDQADVRIHAVTSGWNMTVLDPHVNMLRATTEGMSSVLGGADVVTVLPFDYPHSRNREFSDRIARNIQLILREEAYLERVRDPAAGSYYIENLTDSVAEMAWDLFRRTESGGGFRAEFRRGSVQEQVLQSKKNKKDAVASGRMRLLGTNAFTNPVERIFWDRERLKTGSAPVSNESLSPLFSPLEPFRVAAGYEELRLETALSGKRPKVFLVRYGDPAISSAKATFSTHFFACAGYDIMDPPATGDLKQVIEQALGARSEIVVLCCSEDRIPEMAEAVGKALGGKTILVVAGQPGNMKEKLKKAGINHFIHLKLNMLETLKDFNRILFRS